MNTAALTALRFALLLVVATPGVSSQYAPGKMERVITYRQTHATAYPLPTPLPAADGYIAVRDCAQIGRVWTVIHAGRAERLLVVDCAGDAATVAWMQRGNVLMEVDGATAQRWGTVGRGARVVVVTVSGYMTHSVILTVPEMGL